MKYEIIVEIAQPRTLAAVSTTIPVSDIAAAWKPALDKVWAFLRANPALRPEHNVFLYHHPEHPGDPMNIHFGVQVSKRFDNQGEITCVEAPSGEVARTIHTGPYHRLADAHAAIHQWCKASNRKIADASWEIYGDWNNDPDKLKTTIQYLLR